MMLHIHTFRQITGVKQKASSFVALAVIGFGCQPRWKSKILTRTSLGTVPETNSWPENQWLEESFYRPAYFQGRFLAVGFREGSVHKKNWISRQNPMYDLWMFFPWPFIVFLEQKYTSLVWFSLDALHLVWRMEKLWKKSDFPTKWCSTIGDLRFCGHMIITFIQL